MDHSAAAMKNALNRGPLRVLFGRLQKSQSIGRFCGSGSIVGRDIASGGMI